MKRKLLFILLFISIFVIYLITSGGKTPYDYFIRLAEAFLNGRYYLPNNPPWLNELIPLKNGGFGVVYPPSPAIIALPFVYIWGQDFPQQIIAHIFGAGTSLLFAKIAYLKSKNKKLFCWTLLMTAFGNILWYLSSNGSVWYLGQVMGVFFITASIYESLTKKRPLIVSLFFGLAVLSRLQLVLAFPIVLYLNFKLNYKNISKINIFSYLLPTGLLLALFGYYNFLRFGSFVETGYSLIPNVLNEPWYEKGIFHYSYIENNLRVMFFSLPIFKNEFPYITPSWGGLSIFITSPIFIYMLFASLKEKENRYLWISLILIALINFSHGGTGFTQFGYRYAVDFYPFMFLLVINALRKKGVVWHHWLLLSLSVLVNLWGVLWINKFGWVSF